MIFNVFACILIPYIQCGNPYFYGECECGATIGGADHELVEGNTKMSDFSEQ